LVGGFWVVWGGFGVEKEGPKGQKILTRRWETLRERSIQKKSRRVKKRAD